MTYKQMDTLKIFVFLMIGIITKAIPFYLIRNDPTKLNDIIFGIVVFLIYYMWVSYRIGSNKFIKIYTVDVFHFKTPIMSSL